MYLDAAQEVKEWAQMPFGPAPDEVKSTFRFLGTLRSLKLIGTESFMHATMKNRVAKLVISRILDY